MMTVGELTRLRRQMHRRIRFALALRRVDWGTGTVPARHPGAPAPAGSEPPSPQPALED